MDDAVTELELMDEDETTAIKFGDCFFRVNHTFLFIFIYIYLYLFILIFIGQCLIGSGVS
jgi:hypothetical protein